MKTSTVPPMTLEEAEREAANHRGELVAMTRARDGVYAFAKSYAELLRILEGRNVDLGDVEVDYVADSGEDDEIGLNLTPAGDDSD